MFWKRKRKIILHITLTDINKKDDVKRALDALKGVTSCLFTPMADHFHIAVWARWPVQRISPMLKFISSIHGIKQVETFYFD